MYNLNNSSKERMNPKVIFDEMWEKTANENEMSLEDLIQERSEQSHLKQAGKNYGGEFFRRQEAGIVN